MSWKLTGLVAHKITGSAVRRLVLLTMCDKANDDGSGVYASFATVARECELSRATAKRTIKEFENEGLITQVGKHPCLNGETNDYTVNVTALRALPDLPKHKAPGSQRTRSADTPVASEPGLQSDPGSLRPETRVTVTPKPIQEPCTVVVSAPVGKDRIDALVDRLGAKANHAAGDLRHGAILNQLLRGGCDWFEDIEPAADALAASWNRRDGINSWVLIQERALRLRDMRLSGVRPPEPVTQQSRPTHGRRPSMATVVSRMRAEGKLT